MAANIRALLRNDDHEREQLASFVLAQGRFPWDVI
jgi:hypothetical protein